MHPIPPGAFVVARDLPMSTNHLATFESYAAGGFCVMRFLDGCRYYYTRSEVSRFEHSRWL